MEWNGMNGIVNGMEWNGYGIKWNGIESNEWNRIE